MLKIEKIKEEIKNHDDNSDDYLECWLHQITTNLHDNKNSCSSLTCSECLRLSLLDLLEEYKKPVKLSKFEHEYLKVAKKEGFNFITRDKDDNLYLYSSKPWKSKNDWDYEDRTTPVFAKLFKFVKWEDKKPWNIDNILANCEVIENE